MRTGKRILAIILAVFLVCTGMDLSGFNVVQAKEATAEEMNSGMDQYANENMVTISGGTGEYKDTPSGMIPYADAISYVNTNWRQCSPESPFTITLQGNVTSTDALLVDTDLVLDLKGNTITYSGNNIGLTLQGGSLEIKGEETASITSSNSYGTIILENGRQKTLTISGGKISNNQPVGYAISAETNNSNYSISLRGGSIAGRNKIKSTLSTHAILEDGYCFYDESGEAIRNPKFQVNMFEQDVTYTVKECIHKTDESVIEYNGSNGTCPYCGETFTATVTPAGGGTAVYCATIDDAITKAKETSGSTLTLLANLPEAVTIDGGTFTLDLNGTNQTHKFTFTNGDNITITDTGTEKGTFADVEVTSGKLKLTGGTYTSVSVPSGHVSDLLASGYAYQYSSAAENNAGEWVTNNENWDGTSIANVTVKEAPFILGDPATDKASVTYGYSAAQAPRLSITSTINTGEISFHWQVANVNAAGNVEGEYRDLSQTDMAAEYPLPAGNSAGIYSYRCKVIGDAGYTVYSKIVTVEITAQPGTIVNKDYALTYDYKAAIPTPAKANFTCNNGTGAFTYQWYAGDFTAQTALPEEKKVAAPTNAGDYTLVAYVAADSNGNYSSAECRLKVKVNKLQAKATDFTVALADSVYDGEEKTVAVTKVPTGLSNTEYTLLYQKAGASTALTTTKPTDVGTYTVYVSISGAVNYENIPTTAPLNLNQTITITKATGTIAVAASNRTYAKVYENDDFTLEGITYNGDGKLVYTVSDCENLAGEVVSNDKVITVTDDPKTPQKEGKVHIVNPGTATITVSSVNGSNYTDVTCATTIRITVSKADMPKNKPTVLTPAYTIKKISAVSLPTGWIWQEADRDTALEVGEKVTATAIYNGADKDNFNTLTTTVEVTRSSCNHAKEEIRKAVAATCTKAGYSGDIYCADCGELKSYGKTLSALGHSWDNGVVTKKATATESGIMTYTCSRCQETKEELIAALGIPQKGASMVDETSKAAYKVTKAATINDAGETAGGTVEYTAPENKNQKTISIPATVTIDGVTYQVTSVAAKAFKNNKKVTKVTIGSNVKKIGKQAFYGCKKLKTITIKTSRLTSKNVGSKAFKGISSKATIKVPKKKLTTYKKLLKAKGVSDTVKIRK